MKPWNAAWRFPLYLAGVAIAALAWRMARKKLEAAA